MYRVFVYTHNAQAGTEQLMRLGGKSQAEIEDAVDAIKETAEPMFEVDDLLFRFDDKPLRIITLTPAELSSDGAYALMEELTPLLRTLQPDQSMMLR